jgi:hypothetical protein
VTLIARARDRIVGLQAQMLKGIAASSESIVRFGGTHRFRYRCTVG